jgi:hypothetical protein
MFQKTRNLLKYFVISMALKKKLIQLTTTRCVPRSQRLIIRAICWTPMVFVVHVEAVVMVEAGPDFFTAIK